MRYLWFNIEAILKEYDGSVPLTHFLKAFYKKNPKLGSRDRKMLSEMAYSWYRCHKALPDNVDLQTAIATCVAHCRTENKHLQKFLEGIPVDRSPLALDPLFPFDVSLSSGIEKQLWLESMLAQPKLFIRARKEQDKILAILEEEQIDHEVLDDHCIAVPNGTSIDKLIPEYAYVVQDTSSQKAAEYFTPKPQEQWWDACSGAGGKSLYLVDKEPLVNLTATDRRRSILKNLEERFRTYSHILPVTKVLDVADDKKLQEVLGSTLFDNIICDVPCSGSGTWSRTPEQCYFFDPKSLEELNDIQENILRNASAYLKTGGKLYYITCSVFSTENEEIVGKGIKGTGLKVVEQKLINGITIQADSMFVTVLQKD